MMSVIHYSGHNFYQKLNLPFINGTVCQKGLVTAKLLYFRSILSQKKLTTMSTIVDCWCCRTAADALFKKRCSLRIETGTISLWRWLFNYTRLKKEWKRPRKTQQIKCIWLLPFSLSHSLPACDDFSHSTLYVKPNIIWYTVITLHTIHFNIVL